MFGCLSTLAFGLKQPDSSCGYDLILHSSLFITPPVLGFHMLCGSHSHLGWFSSFTSMGFSSLGKIRALGTAGLDFDRI
jgi:hypothetical protein